jgi:hypothetical protein
MFSVPDDQAVNQLLGAMTFKPPVGAITRGLRSAAP